MDKNGLGEYLTMNSRSFLLRWNPFWRSSNFLDTIASFRSVCNVRFKTNYFLSICSYAKLVSLGKPDLIEVKGVTYCGTSKASKLTMENVPWHEEVIYFVKKLVERLPDYDISCEHEHSNCLLITHKKVKFISSEMATKFCEIFPLLLTTVRTVKCKGKILQNFVAFSEYMNFNLAKLF